MQKASPSIRVKRLVAVAALLASAGIVTTEVAAQDQDNQASLHGTIFIVTEQKSTHVHMSIEGAAAIKMYDAMKARSRADECLGNGWRIKYAGPLQCSISANRKEARCDFTVDLADGRLGGIPC